MNTKQIIIIWLLSIIGTTSTIYGFFKPDLFYFFNGFILCILGLVTSTVISIKNNALRKQKD